MDFADCPYTVNPEGFGDPTEDGADGLTERLRAGVPRGLRPAQPLRRPGRSTPATRSARRAGRPPARLPLGRRREQFVQIPFQVDEQFTRYLDNTASGFALYSGQDQHTTYAYRRARASATREDGPATTRARRSPSTPDRRSTRSPGLDHNDEIAFMASDAGPQAPAGAKLPGGHRERRRSSPSPTRGPERRALRLRRARRPRTARSPRSTRPTATSGTSATRTPTRSRSRESSYDNYGNAQGRLLLRRERQHRPQRRRHAEDRRRRPRDSATITTEPLPLPLRRPLAHDEGRDLQGRRRDLRPRPRRPLEGARVRAGPRVRDAVLRLRGGGQQLGRLVDAARREGRPGARDPRDVGRRLRHERHPPRDLLPRRDEAEDVPARPRHPAARRHLRAVGLQRRPRRHVLPTRAASHAIDGVNDEAYGNFDDPCNPNYDGNGDERRRPAATARFYEQLQLCNGSRTTCRSTCRT